MAFANITQAHESKRSDGDIADFPVADNTVIYKGSLVVLNAGYAEAITDADGLRFVGVAFETVDNTEDGHTAGGKRIRVYKNGDFLFRNKDIELADCLKDIYADLSDATGTPTGVSEEATNGGTYKLIVGKMVEYISATEVRVAIDSAIGNLSEEHSPS